MTLGDLLAAAGLPPLVDVAGREVSRIVDDSREAGPGALFVGVPGQRRDGADFAADALARGAIAAVVGRRPEGLPGDAAVLVVEDPVGALARLAATFHGHPSRRLLVAGVTGTDGKTTTAAMLQAAWQGAGLLAASLTTVDLRIGDRIVANPGRLTTPTPPALQQRLREIVDAGASHVALETSSHALALRRVEEVEYRAAVYTRITSEHLDLHGTREEYVAAKLRLAQAVARRSDGIAVVDADDPDTAARVHAVGVPTIVSYSATGSPTADCAATDVRVMPGTITWMAHTLWGDVELAVPTDGRFNVANAMAAFTCACLTGATPEEAARGLATFRPVPGRMERVDLGQPFTVVVDYAHTAAALATVLGELRDVTPGRLVVVFGSAGERDTTKRPEMGRVAATLADRIVLTDEDPRREDRRRILDEIAEGARAAGARDGVDLHIVPDRAEAIAAAIAEAEPGDTVLLAGKGHERTLETGGAAVSWNERSIAEAAVRRWLALRHPAPT